VVIGPPPPPSFASEPLSADHFDDAQLFTLDVVLDDEKHVQATWSDTSPRVAPFGEMNKDAFTHVKEDSSVSVRVWQMHKCTFKSDLAAESQNTVSFRPR
jgi:hypothetical protein